MSVAHSYGEAAVSVIGREYCEAAVAMHPVGSNTSGHAAHLGRRILSEGSVCLVGEVLKLANEMVLPGLFPPYPTSLVSGVRNNQT